MIKFSRNNLKYQIFGVPPNTLPMVMYTHGYFATWYYCIRTFHLKQFSVGLMVLSDGLTFWRSRIFLSNQPKLSCGFNAEKSGCNYTPFKKSNVTRLWSIISICLWVYIHHVRYHLKAWLFVFPLILHLSWLLCRNVRRAIKLGSMSKNKCCKIGPQL